MCVCVGGGGGGLWEKGCREGEEEEDKLSLSP